jgi:hypothetical protein
MLAHLRVHGFFARLPGGEAVYVAVVHAEGGGDQDGIVDLAVGCAELAGGFYISSSDVLASLLDFAGDD